MDVRRFKKQPILGIVRGVERSIVEPLVETVISAGLHTMEITMNTPNACDSIKEAVRVSGGRLCVGAGTVLTTDQLKRSLDSGATFIVMPALVEDVLGYCVDNKIPAFPGAFTPQEIYTAWQRGATMVKVFPAKFLGPEYFKEIKGPFADVELLACGGVTPDNMKEYFANGASAVSFGASVFKKELLARKDFESIGQHIKRYIQALSLVPAALNRPA